MDDHRTRETLDALADLFLTGTTPPVRKPPAPPTRIPPRKAHDSDAAGVEPSGSTPGSIPSHETSTALADELDGPQSISIGARRTSAERYDDHDEYGPPPANLRLHQDDDSRSDADSDDAGDSARTAHIEAVFLGNLPGFGGPWLTQYAFHMAQQRGPTAILHLTGEQADLELVTAARQNFRAGIDEALPTGASVEALIERMQQMLGDHKQPVLNWLVNLPSPTDAPQRSRAAAIGHWTILCGSDDMAIAAATRMLQQMLPAAADANADAPEDEQTTDSAQPAPLVGVMIMGSDEAKAHEAIDKFNAAASGFLRQPIELIGSRKQMTPVHMRPLGGAAGSNTWPAIQQFLSALPVDEAPATTQAAAQPAAPATATATVPATATAPAPAPVPETESETPVYESTSASSVMEPPSEVEHLTQFDQPHMPAASPAATSTMASPSSSPRSPRGQAAASTTPNPQREAASQYRPAQPAQSSINEPDLVQLLTGSIAGSFALDARYPKQQDTQIILDQAGQLHLLRRQMGNDLRAALVDLIEARDWVNEHAQLIALTQRQCRFDTTAQPTLHLFTADAKNAVAMVNKLGPFVKLHLLMEVKIGAARTWVCTDLN